MYCSKNIFRHIQGGRSKEFHQAVSTTKWRCRISKARPLKIATKGLQSEIWRFDDAMAAGGKFRPGPNARWQVNKRSVQSAKQRPKTGLDARKTCPPIPSGYFLPKATRARLSCLLPNAGLVGAVACAFSQSPAVDAISAGEEGRAFAEPVDQGRPIIDSVQGRMRIRGSDRRSHCGLSVPGRMFSRRFGSRSEGLAQTSAV